MKRSNRKWTSLVLTLTATMAGGSLLTSCQGRFFDAVVTGSKDFLFTLFDPAGLLELVNGVPEE